MSVDRRQVLGGIGAVVTASVVPVGAAAARDDEGDEGDGTTAGLRVAHASPDAPDVDVYVDGSAAVTGLSFRSVTDYLEVPTGEREVEVRVAGTDTTVFGPTTVSLEAEDYTAVARGEVTEGADTDFTVSVFEDTNGANIDDETRVRAIHASPDAPDVTVTVNDGAVTLFEDVSFGESSGYAVVDAAEYEIEIRPASGGDPVFETTATLDAGSTYTAFAVGYLSPDDDPSDEAFGLVLVEDASAPPRGDGDEGDEADKGDEGDEADKGDEGDEADKGDEGSDKGNQGNRGRGD